MIVERKKLYQKPTLERVVLIPEENVLAVCMTFTGSGETNNIAGCQAPYPAGCEGPPTLMLDDGSLTR